MRQRQHPRHRLRSPCVTPVGDCFVERRGSLGTHVPALGIKPDCQHQFDSGHGCHQFCPPGRSALSPRRQVPSPNVLAGEAEAHRQNGEIARVIELALRDAEPAAQPVAGRIREWPAAGVNPCSGSLARDQDAGAGRYLKHRARRMRQRPAPGGIHADAAGARCGGKTVQVGGHVRRKRWAGSKRFRTSAARWYTPREP